MSKESDFLTGTRETVAQCQACGYAVVDDFLPAGWSVGPDGSWYCDECDDVREWLEQDAENRRNREMVRGR